MQEKGQTVYRQICRKARELYKILEHNVERDRPSLVGNSEEVQGIPDDVSMIIQDILWEEDALGIDIRNYLYGPPAVPESQNPVLDPITPEASPVKDIEVKDETPQRTPSTPLAPLVNSADNEDVTEGFWAEKNYADFTYWAIETKTPASYTSAPCFVNRTQRSPTLLEEAEGYVARVLWYGASNGLHPPPRHLLVQASQVMSRAVFDPAYRSYLSHVYEQ